MRKVDELAARAAGRPVAKAPATAVTPGATGTMVPVAGVAQQAPAQQTPRLEWRAISLWQPWATLMALDLKRIETRPRPWRYAGPLLIHATAGRGPEERAAFETTMNDFDRHFLADLAKNGIHKWEDMPHGAIVAAGCFLGCCLSGVFDHYAWKYPERLGTHERDYGDYTAGRWFMPFRLAPGGALASPVPCSGLQALWIPPTEVALAVEAQLPEETILAFLRASKGGEA
jgi:hypothetical protein